MQQSFKDVPRILRGVRVTGIASAVPETVAPVEAFNEQFGPAAVAKISASTGVSSRHIVSAHCTSDLCAEAARRLLQEASVDPASIDALIFVTQTPDYVLPATACVLQGSLGLPDHAAAFDVNMGCSGYVYGLWLASSLIASGGAARVLLLVGDTISRIVSPIDRSVALLFGDAGTATLLEADPGASAMPFVLGTDGKGAKNLIVPAGGFRQPATEAARTRTERESGNRRADTDLYMNGTEIFAFTLARVPPMVSATLQAAGATAQDIDAFVFHQANRFMLQHLVKRMALPQDKVVLGLERFGNTSSASIPLALCSQLSGRLKTEPSKLLLSGFGVGYSWASCILETNRLVVPEVAVMSEQS